MFHEVHFVEKWDRGIGLILSREPDTDFKEVCEIFITTFPRKGIKKTAPETREKKYPEKVGERWSEKWSETLSKRQIEILKLIMNNPRISRKELSKSIGINQSAIQKHLDKLKQAGILERIGSARGGHWEVKG
nr:putative regulatory protein [uncultured archaeon]